MRFFIQGKDIIAAILLIGCFYLKAMNLDGVIDKVILGIALTYGLVNFMPPAKKKP